MGAGYFFGDGAQTSISASFELESFLEYSYEKLSPLVVSGDNGSRRRDPRIARGMDAVVDCFSLKRERAGGRGGANFEKRFVSEFSGSSQRSL